MSHYIDQALAQIEQFEGRVPWMYLDTKSKVTVGIGCERFDSLPARDPRRPFISGRIAWLSVEFGLWGATEQ